MGVLFKVNMAKIKQAETSSKVKLETRRAMKIAGEYILEEANKTVPYRDGILESSGTVSTDGKTVCISYNTPYARRLHEHPEYNFRGKGQGKWLVRTVTDKYVQSSALKIMKGEIKI